MYDIDSGEQVFRASYDAWGRQTVEQNNINLQRGYCGHDMLSDYDLIDMGGRVYDPVIGRFLSCDNYVQEPDNSQNFNRYSYCLNNPLRYTDPDGEFWWIVAGIALGGAVNWAMNGAQFNAKGLEYFGVGALGTAAVVGGSVIGTPLMGALAGGFVMGAGNNWVQTGTFNAGNMMLSGTMGAFIGGISFGLGSYFDGIASSWFSGITNTTLRITTTHATSGVLTGGILGAGMYCFNGAEGRFWDNVLSGAATGLVTGTASGFIKAKQQTHLSNYNTKDLRKNEIQWPENGGALDDWRSKTLNSGEVIDRYGDTSGKYASPQGTPFEQRSLPANSKESPYNIYEILEPLDVKSSTIAPAFGQQGGGTQYLFDKQLQYYIDNGYLRIK